MVLEGAETPNKRTAWTSQRTRTLDLRLHIGLLMLDKLWSASLDFIILSNTCRLSSLVCSGEMLSRTWKLDSNNKLSTSSENLPATKTCLICSKLRFLSGTIRHKGLI